MSLELGYGIAGIFCAAACVIVGLGAMQSNGLVSREPLAIAAFAGTVMLASALNWYPEHTVTLCYVAIAVSLLAAWAAWKDYSAATAAVRQGKSTS